MTESISPQDMIKMAEEGIASAKPEPEAQADQPQPDIEQPEAIETQQEEVEAEIEELEQEVEEADHSGDTKRKSRAQDRIRQLNDEKHQLSNDVDYWKKKALSAEQLISEKLSAATQEPEETSDDDLVEQKDFKKLRDEIAQKEVASQIRLDEADATSQIGVEYNQAKSYVLAKTAQRIIDTANDLGEQVSTQDALQYAQSELVKAQSQLSGSGTNSALYVYNLAKREGYTPEVFAQMSGQKQPLQQGKKKVNIKQLEQDRDSSGRAPVKNAKGLAAGKDMQDIIAEVRKKRMS